MTLAKTSKWSSKRAVGKTARLKRRPKISTTLWGDRAETPLADGPLAFASLDLLAMTGDDGSGGYPVVASAPLCGAGVAVDFGAPPSSSAPGGAASAASPTTRPSSPTKKKSRPQNRVARSRRRQLKTAAAEQIAQ